MGTPDGKGPLGRHRCRWGIILKSISEKFYTVTYFDDCGTSVSLDDFINFTHGERALGIHWIGGWVNPRAGLDDVEKRKFLPPPGFELRPLGRPARS
jgi:hypothetical protein